MLYPERYNNLSDVDLISEYQKDGNKAIVGILYKRYSHLVLGLCMKYLRSLDEAEDMVIHVFTKLLEDLAKHQIEYFKSWLYTYSKNHCLMHLRSAQVRLKKELEYKENIKLLVESDDELHQKITKKEVVLTALELAIEELTHEQKICIKLFYLRQKSYQEIVDETGYSLNNVKSFIQNGKRNLKIKLISLEGEAAGIIVSLLFYLQLFY
jgi:RNA polymerase sigma-70 factor (ECF subfamily)